MKPKKLKRSSRPTRSQLESELRELLESWKGLEEKMLAEEQRHASDTLPATYCRGAISANRRAQAQVKALLE